jgi:F-box-like
MINNANSAPPMSLDDTDIGASAFSSTTVVKAAYKRINDEIAGLEAGIRVWKTSYNTLSITARLPPEILSTIFKCVATAQHSTYDRLMWINVTHVCTHWRRVALEDPSLWTTIPFSNLRWANEMLERSKMAPLTVMTDLYAKDSPHMELVQSTLTKIARIQKVSLTQHRSYLLQGLLEMVLGDLVEPAPFLESLEVSFNDRSSVHRLPPSIFSGEAPRLRQLELRDCALTWDMPFLRTLTSLTISFVPPAARPSMRQIVASLSNMSNLDILVLRDVLPEGSADAAPGEVGDGLVARLPQLTYLCIESDVPEGAFLLARLIYPSTVSVTLVGIIRCESTNTVDFSQHLPSLRNFCAALGKSQPVRCLCAHYIPYYNSIHLKTYDTPGTCLYPPQNLKFDFTLKLSSLYTDPALTTFWEDIHRYLWKSIPMKDLETLHTTQFLGHQENWTHIFNTLAATKLKRLRITGSSGIHFLRVLSPDAPAPQTGRAKRRIPLQLPSLRELSIGGWTFDDEEDSGTCFELLKICLADRRKRRAAIQELFLNDCIHITADDVGILKKIVKNVTWDGCENFSEDEESDEECERCGTYGCDGFDCEEEYIYGFGLPW